MGDTYPSLMGLSLHRNPGGFRVYSVALWASEGKYNVLVKRGKDISTCKSEVEVPYSGDNAILAREMFEATVKRLSKTFKRVSKPHWMYDFFVTDVKTHGTFSANIANGRLPWDLPDGGAP